MKKVKMRNHTATNLVDSTLLDGMPWDLSSADILDDVVEEAEKTEELRRRKQVRNTIGLLLTVGVTTAFILIGLASTEILVASSITNSFCFFFPLSFIVLAVAATLSIWSFNTKITSSENISQEHLEEHSPPPCSFFK